MICEHLATLDFTSAGSYKFAIPKNGLRGVYSSAPVTLGYEDNGNIGTLLTNVQEWEPANGFHPAPSAYLVITTAGPTKVSIRYEA